MKDMEVRFLLCNESLMYFNYCESTEIEFYFNKKKFSDGSRFFCSTLLMNILNEMAIWYFTLILDKLEIILICLRYALQESSHPYPS